MEETYCGKTCAECGRKEELNCPGCNAGPGKPYDGDCILAKCARGKGHETCATCIYSSTCGTLMGKNSIPDQRIRKIEAEKQRKAMLVKRAEVMGKWLWIMFWLMIGANVPALLSNDYFAQHLPGLYLAGAICGLLFNLACCLILLKLGREYDGYRVAGILFLVGSVISALRGTITWMNPDAGGLVLLSLPAAVANIVATYQEYTAHSAVLVGVDDVLSEKWGALWRWYIRCYLGMFGCIILMGFAPLLGVVLVFAAIIALLVMTIMEMVYLYRTAKIFREYTA